MAPLSDDPCCFFWDVSLPGAAMGVGGLSFSSRRVPTTFVDNYVDQYKYGNVHAYMYTG